MKNGSMNKSTTTLEQLTKAFWKIDTMYDESSSMILREDGTIRAKLLFKPIRILSVYDTYRRKLYKQGKDYVWDGKSNELIWIPGSDIPFFTKNDIEGRDENGVYIENQYGNADELGRTRFRNALHCTSPFLYEKHIRVTYTHQEKWKGPVTEFQGACLPRTMSLLRTQKKLKVTFFGDSIFTGCDSSSMHNRPPYQKSFPVLIAEVLEQHYGSAITLVNPSAGGKKSIWGMNMAKELLNGEAQDLVILGFGMNDGAIPPEQTADAVRVIMDTVLEVSPSCEFIVVTTIVPNIESGFMGSHPKQREALRKLAGPGVAFVDMYSFHERLLESKDFISMSGNNINHPNDWLICGYAMNILSVLIP